MKLNDDINQFIKQHLHESTERIVLNIRNKFDIDPYFIIQQINGRKKVAAKIPSWANNESIIFPNIVSFEQCSSEATAGYKARLIQGHHLVDLTGGFGVDTYFLAQKFKQVDYFEQNEALFDVVKNNYHQLQVSNIRMHHGNGIDFLENIQHPVDWIYLDPSRRQADHSKIFLIEDCQPNILEINDLLLAKAKNVLIKLSPMLDIDQIIRKVAGLQKIHIVSVKNECKEVLLHISATPNLLTPVALTAVNIHDHQNFDEFTTTMDKRKKENITIQLSKPLDYIYEPNKSILKGNLQDYLAETKQISKLNTHSNFFTSSDEKSDFPGRIFQVKTIIKLKKKQITKHLDKGKANVISRNFPLKASQIYEKFKIIPGGSTYLLATKLKQNDNVLIVCERLK
ncbi:MAG TPA: SAM-dependent methyltransferase [Saprospiraceae bacterium]|nr:SAM-dependent methyltransferase [Saprospiraceae bacterium]